MSMTLTSATAAAATFIKLVSSWKRAKAWLDERKRKRQKTES
jgi:hypothetical protein